MNIRKRYFISVGIIRHTSLTRYFHFLDAFVRIVLYVDIDSDRFAVVIEFLIKRRLQVQLVGTHHELFAHLHRRLLALFTRCIHNLPNSQSNRVPVQTKIKTIKVSDECRLQLNKIIFHLSRSTF